MANPHIVRRVATSLHDVGRAWAAWASAPLIGIAAFALAVQVVGDPNNPATLHGLSPQSRAVMLAIVVEIAPLLGAYWAGRAVWRGDPRGRAPFIANVALGLLFVLK
jgi:hypothetical protein